MTKLDDAWAKVFIELNVLEEIQSAGYIKISSSELRRIGLEEARLMAKIDSLEKRPKLFKENTLSILPIENGSYIVYKDPELLSFLKIGSAIDNLEVEQFIPDQVDFESYDTLQLQNITTESQAIDFIYLTKLLDYFCRDEGLLLTIRGRSRSRTFEISVPNVQQTVVVNGVQIEVDAGFESYPAIYLIEAKLSRYKNFNLRQLYYPFKNWSRLSRKRIVPIFFTYTNGLFYLVRLELGETFGDVRIEESRCFTINEPAKQTIHFRRFLQNITPSTEPTATFPQANDLDKVIDVVRDCENGLLTKEDIARFLDYDLRQADYYANAAIYLDLIRRDPSVRSTYILTDVGLGLVSSQRRGDRNRILLEQMLRSPIIYQSFIRYFSPDNGLIPQSNEYIRNIIREYRPELRGDTPIRRASTIWAWLRWIDKSISFIMD